jgi:RNA polymerase sigma factor (sigma-70 family)
MSPDESFDALMARLRARDEAAASLVWDRYVRQLISLARSHLNTLVRRKVDPDEVVQSVFRSFFLRQAAGQFDLTGWDGLWGLLAKITIRKCGHKVRHFYGPVHDVRKEVTPTVGDDESRLDWDGLSREPSPEEAASLIETVDGLMEGLADRDRQIVELRLQGYTVPEISAQVGRTEFTVEGRLKHIRKRLKEMLPPGEAEGTFG